MGFDPLSIGIGVALSAASVGSTLAENKAAEDRYDDLSDRAHASNRLNKYQLNQQARDRRVRLSRQLEQYVSSVRVSAGERGLSARGMSLLASPAGQQAAESSAAVGDSLRLQELSSDINTHNLLVQQRPQLGSPFMAGVTGALQGLQVGLRLQDTLGATSAIPDTTGRVGDDREGPPLPAHLS